MLVKNDVCIFNVEINININPEGVVLDNIYAYKPLMIAAVRPAVRTAGRERVVVVKPEHEDSGR